MQGGRPKKECGELGQNDIIDPSLVNADDLSSAAIDDDSNDAADCMTNVENDRKSNSCSVREEDEEEDIAEDELDDNTILQLMGLDQAILHSIDSCGTYLVTLATCGAYLSYLQYLP